jgi:DNA-binding IclR family transcriptional regulator
VVSDALTRVTQEIKRDVHVSIWTPAGPLIARWKQGPTDINIRVREGATLPLLMSATGRVWAHYLPRDRVKPLMDAEFDAIKTSGKKKLRETLEQRIAAVGRHGLARSEEEMRPGIDALSGPIFNRDGLAFAMTVLSPHGSTDLSYEGAAARAFRAILQDLSRQLGGRV